jgi:hypothetical protein
MPSNFNLTLRYANSHFSKDDCFDFGEKYARLCLLLNNIDQLMKTFWDKVKYEQN